MVKHDDNDNGEDLFEYNTSISKALTRASTSFQISRSKGRISISTTDKKITHIATGGAGEVYLLDGSERHKFAAKIYLNPERIDWNKISHLVSNPINISNIFSKTSGFQFAWPLEVITYEDQAIGILMPYFDRQEFITLDNWVESLLLKKLSEANDSLGRRLLILKNLAGGIAKLHEHKHAFVDLKPANVLINKTTAEICLIDCDSIRSTAKNGKVYPASHVSAGYIAPEAVEEMNIGALNKEQDRHAYAVIVFQILNYGIHPFQGILKRKIKDVDTDDKKAAKWLYAYGNTPSKDIKPVKPSVHKTWPNNLKNYLDRAFTESLKRPTAKEWKTLFDKIIASKGLQACQKFPKDARHIRFEGLPCAACTRANAISSITKSKQTKENSISSNLSTKSQTQTKTPSPKNTSIPPPTVTPQKPSGANSGLKWAAAIAIFLVLYGLWVNEDNTVISPDNSHRSVSNNTGSESSKEWVFVEYDKGDYIYINSKEQLNAISLRIHKRKNRPRELYPLLVLKGISLCDNPEKIQVHYEDYNSNEVVDLWNVLSPNDTEQKLLPGNSIHENLVQTIRKGYSIKFRIVDMCIQGPITFSLAGSMSAIKRLETN